MTDLMLRADEGGVATLTMNAPASLNALSDAMLAALKAAFARLAEDRDARVVILRGAGRAFCAGHDLKEMQAGRAAPDRGRAYFPRNPGFFWQSGYSHFGSVWSVRKLWCAQFQPARQNQSGYSWSRLA